MTGNLYTWILALITLSVAIAINTALVDEVVRLLDENIPIAKIRLHRKLGWDLSMAASAFCLLAVVSYIIVYLILVIQTDKNHDNITNEELEWKEELEKREIVTIR